MSGGVCRSFCHRRRGMDWCAAGAVLVYWEVKEFRHEGSARRTRGSRGDVRSLGVACLLVEVQVTEGVRVWCVRAGATIE